MSKWLAALCVLECVGGATVSGSSSSPPPPIDCACSSVETGCLSGGANISKKTAFKKVTAAQKETAKMVAKPAEAKQKTMKKKAATKEVPEQAMSAVDAAPAKATKAKAAVQIWAGLISDSTPLHAVGLRSQALVGRLRAHPSY